MINNRAYRGVGMEAALGKVENHKNRMTPPPPTSFFTDPDKKKVNNNYINTFFYILALVGNLIIACH